MSAVDVTVGASSDEFRDLQWPPLERRFNGLCSTAASGHSLVGARDSCDEAQLMNRLAALVGSRVGLDRVPVARLVVGQRVESTLNRVRLGGHLNSSPFTLLHLGR